jgi:uncharacterized integral membrane protein
MKMKMRKADPMGSWLRNFLKFIVIAPLAVIFLSFDMANRQNVLISFDPFNSGDSPLPKIEAPLFVVLIGTLMFGVLLGSVATWMRQGRSRRAARDARNATETLRGENETLRDQIAALKSAPNYRSVTTRNAA